MCGICGVVDLDGARIDEAEVDAMTDLLTHRGPDGRGVARRDHPGGPSVFLGHRRLRIIDLSDAAAQPMPNEDDSCLLVFNGEIYNFQELRRDLQGRGHVFRSRSDTEVIVHAYESFGAEAVTHLDGMFAFALWDDRTRRLLLARDRCGKKPLYYSFDGRRFTFASEIKSLLACPWIDRDRDEERFAEYLTYGYISSPRTMFRAIRQLPAGSSMILDPDGVTGPQRYWRADFSSSPVSVSLEEASESLVGILEAAVHKRLVSDVPLGAFLSGGIDSAVVVALMSRLSREPVQTFTIGFADDPSYDESIPARSIARHLGTEHREFVLSIDGTALAEDLVWYHDQPFADASALPTYLVSQMAREHVTVALVGDGGDELFAGYDRFRAALLSRRVPRSMARLGGVVARTVPRNPGYHSLRRRLMRFADGASLSPASRYLRWIALFSEDTLSSLLMPELRSKVTHSNLSELHTTVLAENSGKPLLHQLLALNFEAYLSEDLLVKMDRMSMAHSLETRSPLLDTALIEYVNLLPPDMKIRGRVTKFLLRHAFQGLLPKEVLTRPKHGFGVPMRRWFRSGLDSMFQDLVLDPTARVAPYLDQKVLTSMLEDDTEGRAENAHRLWAVLNLELWLRMAEGPRLRPRPTASLITDVRMSSDPTSNG